MSRNPYSPVPDTVVVDDQPRWSVVTASARGALHVHSGTPMQDSVMLSGDPALRGTAFVVAVADGHGDRRHFRSNTGSRLAVEVAGGAGGVFGQRAMLVSSQKDVAVAVQCELVHAIDEAWRAAVADDIRAHPFGEDRPDDGETLVPYGTTLLVAVMAFPWLVLCQIGDGDIMVGTADSIEVPVPGDPLLDGLHTTSLCQHDAVGHFRHSVIDVRSTQAQIVLLATDGFGNSQVDQPWYEPVGDDLVRMAAERGSGWLREQVPTWVNRCASAEGSGDDTALGLLVREVA